MPRPYVKRTRAEREAATRRRIIDATIELHQALGGPATTITAIAARAQVSRVTVYRHFPDERALLAACTGTYLQEHRPPDPGAWANVPEVQTRLRLALGELYPFYRQNQGLLARADQEIPSNPVLGDVLSGYLEAVAAMCEVLAAGWQAEDILLLRAAIGHAVAFATWRSLAIDQGLGDPQAAALMVHLVGAAAQERAAPDVPLAPAGGGSAVHQPPPDGRSGWYPQGDSNP
jgi:AcrR family transcriptional regulator